MIAGAVLYSCNKSASDVAVTAKTTSVNLINAVTDISAIDFYINGTRQNTNTAVYYLGSSGYLTVVSGSQQYQFKNDTLDKAVLASASLKLDTNINYSIIVAGQQRAGNVAPILLADSAKADTSKTAKVRFVQASPGSTAYDVYVGDTVNYKNMSFLSASKFLKVGSGIKKLKVFTAGSATTGTPLINTTITVSSGSFYTLFTKGVQSGTGNNAFGTQLFLTK